MKERSLKNIVPPPIGIKHPCYIIAEAGVNHNGDLNCAKELVDVAVSAEADAVKFQSYITEELVCRHAQIAEYQRKGGHSASDQFDLLKRYELDFRTQKEISNYCKRKGIQFLSSAFDTISLGFLIDELHLRLLKIPSGEITNAPLLLQAARSQRPMIVSTGMCTREEIEKALTIIAFGITHPTGWPISEKDLLLSHHSKAGSRWIKDNIFLLHCTSEYPAPFHSIHLNTMKTIALQFDQVVGYSDHTTGIHVAIAAVALGAAIIEKHFTLDRKQMGPDHSASLEPEELREMISCIRQVEKSLGSDEKSTTTNEIKNSLVIRKSIVAKKRIEVGEKFRPDNICCKRPGDGVSPMHYWTLLGTPSDRIYKPDTLIRFSGDEPVSDKNF